MSISCRKSSGNIVFMFFFAGRDPDSKVRRPNFCNEQLFLYVSVLRSRFASLLEDMFSYKSRW